MGKSEYCPGIRAAMDEIEEFDFAFKGVHGRKPNGDEIEAWMEIRNERIETEIARAKDLQKQWPKEEDR